MKRIFFLIAMLVALSPCAFGQSPAIGMSGGNITYSAGTVTVQGVGQNITAGQINGPFVSNENNCAMSAIVTGSDSCEYVYWAAGTGLNVSSSFCSAMPNVIGIFTTDGGGNPVAVSAYSPTAAVTLYESQNLCGAVSKSYVVSSSNYWGGTSVNPCTASSPCFNPAIQGKILYMGLTTNVTSMTIVAPPDGTEMKLTFGQPTSGPTYSVVWPANIKWSAGSTTLGLCAAPNPCALTIAPYNSTITGAHMYYSAAEGAWHVIDGTWYGEPL